MMALTTCSFGAARRSWRWVAASVLARALALALVLPLAACGLLDVSNPTKVEEDELNSATSANMLRLATIFELSLAVSDDARYSGLLTDEFFYDPSPINPGLGAGASEVIDRRESALFEPMLTNNGTTPYISYQQTRRLATVALPFILAYTLEPVRSAYATHLYSLRGFAALMLADNYCPGFPLNELKDGALVRGQATTTEQAYEYALANFDSAVALNADSARYRNFAKIGKARALLGLGRFAEAGAAVAGVPTDYVYQISYAPSSVSFQPNRLRFSFFVGSPHQSAANRDGGTGLDYITSRDPRIKVTPRGPANFGADSVYTLTDYPIVDAPFPIANGIEARLIEAEAALVAGGDWLGILNELRRNHVTPALTDTTDPGTDVARQDLLFRERAFWLYATGHRLGDVRRLIAHYGRTPESVFPTGVHRVYGAYSTATSIPFPAALEHADNPAITGCTTR